MFISIIGMLSLSACVGNTTRGHTNKSETASLITPDVAPTSDASVNTENTDGVNSSVNSEIPATMPTISIQIENQTFHATLYNNPSAKALMKRFPFTLDMQELKGNEKYFFFSENLPSDSSHVGNIQAGDLMLYGSDCLVLFYKSFSTSYSYTRLGRIENPAGLAEALGNGSVSVTFDLEK
ncbi:MAG: cyclophilin-like fold protein [Bacillota bacterium]|nr:cyclophilin-like fold protein [Bacillota bacterium]